MPEGEERDPTEAVAYREMPRYKCHKTVHALRIKAINFRPLSQGGGATLEFHDEGFAPINVVQDWVTKHSPQVGGYYVVYEDGYESWSPQVAFERGYTRET